MRANPLREIWSKGGAVLNGWIAIPHPFSVEVMAHQGWDSLTVDMQHGVAGYEATLNSLIAISTTPTVPLVRVPWLEPSILMKALDAGAYGVICPMVNTVADAELLVQATTYPPRGGRSFGPIRALYYGGADYPKQADDTVVRFAMIETRAGLDNVREIARVDGLDAIYIGPADLSSALGCTPKFDQDEKLVVDAIDHILGETRAAGKIAGIHNGTSSYARGMIEKGFRFVTVASDARLMAAGAKAVVTELAGARGGRAA